MLKRILIYKGLILILLCFLHADMFAQKAKADSLYLLLNKAKSDTERVFLMWNIAGATNIYDPEKALPVAVEAYSMAKRIKYIEGQSRSSGVIANTFIKLGNYPRALEFNLQKLKLEEQRNNYRNLASVLISIGVVYRHEEEYQSALIYYYKADSVIRQYNIDDLKYYSLLNLGDVYDKLNIMDSAFSYYNKALIVSYNLNIPDFIGTSMTGLGHIYRKQGNYPFSLLNYQSAISYLKSANDDEVLSEDLLGLARLYQMQNKSDSAAYYASLSLDIAEKGAFMNTQIEAAQFLTVHYQKLKNIDSAFTYLTKLKQLNDSVNSKSRVRETQILSSNEQLRQIEIEENKKVAAQERKQQLQLLFIAIFIPGFFLLTLLLSRIKIHIRAVKISGVLSLLILFEYLTLLLHPTVANLTNHTPVYEMFIFVSIAALLIPAHHRIELWLIHKLTHHRDGSINMKKVKIKMVNPQK